MQVIQQLNKCSVVQDSFHNLRNFYKVISNNQIILFQSLKVVEAVKYAEWFDKK